MIKKRLIPIATTVGLILLAWYAAAVVLNAPFEYAAAERIGKTVSFSQVLPKTMMQERPVLPAPHQVATEIWKTTIEKKITSKRY